MPTEAPDPITHMPLIWRTGHGGDATSLVHEVAGDAPLRSAGPGATAGARQWDLSVALPCDRGLELSLAFPACPNGERCAGWGAGSRTDTRFSGFRVLLHGAVGAVRDADECAVPTLWPGTGWFGADLEYAHATLEVHLTADPWGSWSMTCDLDSTLERCTAAVERALEKLCAPVPAALALAAPAIVLMMYALGVGEPFSFLTTCTFVVLYVRLCARAWAETPL